MSPEEKKELDDWAKKQYPISMRRLKFSNPFYEKGKLSILLGISLYVLHIFSKIDISDLSGHLAPVLLFKKGNKQYLNNEGIDVRIE